MEYAILLIIIVPMILSILSYAIGGNSKDLRSYYVPTLISFMFFIVVFCSGFDIEANFKNILYFGISFKTTGISSLLAIIACLIYLVVILISKKLYDNDPKANRFYSVYLFTLSTVIGLFMSNDLFTAFVLLEVMFISTVFFTVHNENEQSINATFSYVAVNIVSAFVTLIGMLLVYKTVGSFSFDTISTFIDTNGSSSLLIPLVLVMFAYIARIGLYPLHIWLPKTFLETTNSGTTIFSAILSITGVFGLMVVVYKLLPGNLTIGYILSSIGLITAIIAGFRAMFSKNIKTLLSYGSLSQLGIITVGLGISAFLGENGQLSTSGVISSLINHTLSITILFSLVAILFLNTFEFSLDKLKGYGKGKILLQILFLIACLNLSGVPFTAGYFANYFTYQGIIEFTKITSEIGSIPIYGTILQYGFILTQGLTVAYCLKLYFSLFVIKPEFKSPNKKYASYIALFSLAGIGLILLILGIFPNVFVPYINNFVSDFTGIVETSGVGGYFNLSSSISLLISFVIGFILFYVFIYNNLIGKKHCIEDKEVFDVEKVIYKPFFIGFLPNIFVFCSRILDFITDFIVLLFEKLFFKMSFTKLKPKEDDYFATYDKKWAPKNINEKDSLSRTLIYIGLGIVAILLITLL